MPAGRGYRRVAVFISGISLVTFARRGLTDNTMQLNEQHTSTEADIIHHFRSSGDALAAETAVLDAVIRDIVISGKKVTSKAIILYLIAELESSSDVAELDVLRSALEIVVGKTPDDENF
ncbi:Biofilm development protein YmgB/AriR [Candidatus Pantoea floridensis]|uniref:Biofilm development protein YmgB/AriR n=2 Tax=Erwiniaceae TaxID=1903409 RepID=A0A286DRV0_9GAMM|nr:Biofilm development protein YmgB/AriR [Pantoea floridensis]